MKLRVPVLALAACGLVLTGCGGGSEASSKKSGEALALADAKAVVLDYFEKSFAGDPAACEHESEKYARELDEQNGVADCAERVESVKVMLTDGEPLMDVSKTKVEMSEGEAGAAVAEVTHEMEGFGGTYELVVSDGEWVIDGEVGSELNAFGVEPREVSEQEAEAVAKAFCRVEPGVSRKDVESWLGEPSDESVDEDGLTEVSWYLNQDVYSVWFNAEEKVEQSSGSTPREDDPCA